MASVAGSRALRWLVCCSAAALLAGTAVQASGVVRPEPVNVSTAYAGPGFDPCWAPGDAEMDAWLQSPYRAIGVYLGGPRYATGCRAANSANLTPAWVRRQAAKGWRFLPIYVGSQAWYPAAAAKPSAKNPPGPKPPKPGGEPGGKPGVELQRKSKPDLAPDAVPHLSDFDALTTDTAYARAVAEADDAVRIASDLGFAPGAVLYNDMEGYPGTYRARVLAYSRGWTAELHRLGYRSGWYSSADSGIRDQSRAYGPDSPDVVDIADWNGNDSVDDPSVEPTQWRNHQRAHQTAGDHQETWGGVTLSVDSDWIDVGTADRGTVERLAGWDRDETAVAVSRRAFDCARCMNAGHDQAESAVLSRNDAYADALGGAALAAQFNGPLLLTPSSRLGRPAAAELHRVLAPGSTVFLLGGPRALSPQVEDAVRAEGFVPVRIAGRDRYETAVQIARTVSPGRPPSSILVVPGTDFRSALAASAAAGALGAATTKAELADAQPDGPGDQPDAQPGDQQPPARHGAAVVLTDAATMPPATAAYLATLNPRTTKLYAIGAEASTALTSSQRSWKPAGDFATVTDPDHHVSATAVAVATAFFPQATSVVITSAHDWPDALAGSALAARWNAPLLFTDRNALPHPTERYLAARTKPITTEIIIGGEKNVTLKTATAVGDATTPAGLWDLVDTQGEIVLHP
ncbi:glycoside hydrolase domain-containing protein [Catenulispora subtropica]|uniref:Rv2525c-like glycoside hydrolase-like domain-containing protein n=1 Tax=Catenulispora subtropica TaxID=450798 RepID=A0ABN2S0P0_9ACTN